MIHLTPKPGKKKKSSEIFSFFTASIKPLDYVIKGVLENKTNATSLSKYWFV